MNDLERARAEGVEAYLTSKQVKDCPYSKTTEAGQAWLRGWSTSRFGEMQSNNE